jgi:serine/threonine protein kinase
MQDRRHQQIRSLRRRSLAEAHDSGIVHRDLKPENLFVIKDDQLKILDFGLAKLTVAADPDRIADEGPFKTEIGRILGTVGYMSPEQVRGQSIDYRSDLFSVGAILYELFSGERAFRGESPADIMSAILHKDPEELRVGVPPAVNRTIRHALEKDPHKRFQSAHDLAFQLQESGSGRLSSYIGFHFIRHVNSIILPRRALMISAPLAALLVRTRCQLPLRRDLSLPRT